MPVYYHAALAAGGLCPAMLQAVDLFYFVTEKHSSCGPIYGGNSVDVVTPEWPSTIAANYREGRWDRVPPLGCWSTRTGHLLGPIGQVDSLVLARWCKIGQLGAVRAAVDGNKYTRIQIWNCLCYSTVAGHLTLSKWLVARLSISSGDIRKSDRERFFLTTCAWGPARSLKWILKTFDLAAALGKIWTQVFAHGSPKKVQILLKHFSRPRVALEGYIQASLCYDNLAMVKWAFRGESSPVRLHEYLGCACRWGSLRVARWLIEHYAIKAESVKSYHLLLTACQHGHVQLADYLFSVLTPADLWTDGGTVLRTLYKNRYITPEMLKWLECRAAITEKDLWSP